MSTPAENVVFPEAFGFCGGVRAADDLLASVATEAADRGVPVYGYHDVVHNKDVTRKHEANGITFVGELDEIPDFSSVVISAHGASPQIISDLTEKGCEVFDATCPLVTRTHKGAREARAADEKVLYICKGKPGKAEQLHDEVAGMVGHLDFELLNGALSHNPVDRAYFEIGDPLLDIQLAENAKYRIIWQTTLHAQDATDYRAQLESWILARQPAATFGEIPVNYVCNAVQDRQEGVRKLVELGMPRIVIVTDPKSKNGMGYVELAKELATSNQQVHAVANAQEAAVIAADKMPTGLGASASTPDPTFAEVAQLFGAETVPETDKSFTLPDAKPGVMAAKMAALQARIRESHEGEAI